MHFKVVPLLQHLKMVEVVASLPDRSVYLAGETIECSVTFTNVSHKLHGKNLDGSSSKLVFLLLFFLLASFACTGHFNQSSNREVGLGQCTDSLSVFHE